MKVKVCCFVLLLIAFGTCQAQAQKLTVYTEEFPPFNYTQGNKITGVSTEVVIRVLAKAGIDADIKSLPWKESFKLAQKLPNTLIYSIGRHKKRENLFKWIGIITPSTYSVMALASRTDIRINRLEDLRGYRIGTTIDDIAETWLAGKGFEPYYFIRTGGENPTLKIYKSLLNNRIDVWPVPDAVAHHVVRREGHTDPEAIVQKVFPLQELSTGYYLAASPGTSDAMVARLSLALTTFKQSEDYTKLLNHWGIDTIGMGESVSISKLIYSLKSLTRIATVGYLAGDSIDSHQKGGKYRLEMREDYFEHYVKTFDEWLEQYVVMQNRADVIIIGSADGIAGWDHARAVEHIMNRTIIPTGCLEYGMADYACIGFEGSGMVLNMKVAEKTGIRIPRSVSRQAARLID